MSKSEDSLPRVDVHLLFMANAGLYSTCGSEPIQAAEAEKVWQALQINLLTLSSNSRLMVAEVSGHNIQLDQPGLVVEVVQEMVEQYRKEVHQ